MTALFDSLRHDAKTEKGRERLRGVLTAAIDVFIECGYERASLSKIIERSGGSRSTVYSSFGSKEGLFTAALGMMAGDIYNAYVASYRHGRTIKEDLLSFATIFLKAMLSPRSLGAVRLIYSETVHLPQIGEWFWREGLAAGYEGLAKVLENHVDAPMDELRESAAHFIELLRGPLYHKALCIPAMKITDEAVAHEAVYCTEFFLAYLEKRGGLRD